MDQDQQNGAFGEFVSEIAAVITRYNTKVTANEMIKAFRHIEVDLMAAMMVAIRTTRADKFVIQEDPEQKSTE